MIKLTTLLLVLSLGVPAFAAKRISIPHEDRVQSRTEQLDAYEARLNAWDSRIASLRKRAKTPKLKRARRQRLDYAVIDLEKGVEEARRDFRTLKDAKDRDWDERKVSLEQRLDSIKKSYRSGLAE